MAAPKQQGFLQLSGGSLGKTTFVKDKNGYRAQEKKVQNSTKFKQSRKYERTRENCEEFGSASTCAKLIRQSVASLIGPRTDAEVSNNLVSSLSKVIKLDAVSEPGKRMPTPGKITLLNGFNMNSSSSLKNVFNSRFRIMADWETGKFGLLIPSFIPVDRIKAPRGTTHFMVLSGCSSIDFASNTLQRKDFRSELIRWDDIATTEIMVSHTFPENNLHTIFQFLGLEFYQVTPAGILPVSGKMKDPLCIVYIGTEPNVI